MIEVSRVIDALDPEHSEIIPNAVALQLWAMHIIDKERTERYDGAKVFFFRRAS